MRRNNKSVSDMRMNQVGRRLNYCAKHMQIGTDLESGTLL